MLVRKKKINNSLILKNKYSNFMINRYRKICKRLSNLYSKENSKFVNFYLNNIKKIKDKTIRKNYQLWFEEVAAKYYLAQKLKINKIAVFDEGFIQRSFFAHHLTKDYNNKIDKYFSLINYPDYAIYLDMKTKNLYKRSNLRKDQEKNNFVYKNFKEIKRYKVFFKYVLKN